MEDIKKEVDIIDEPNYQPDIRLKNNRFKRFFVSNVFGRAWSHLIAMSTLGLRQLRCTTGGILQVTSTGTIYETNETFTGTAADAWSASLVFAQTPSKVEVRTRTFGMNIERSTDGIVWQDAIPLEVNSNYDFEASTPFLRLQNGTPGSNATYTIIVWY